MSDESAFLAAVIANPDDDAPRLIYADWLDENGDSERAELIRLQCQLAIGWDRIVSLDGDPESEREQALLKKNRQRWLSDMPAVSLVRSMMRVPGPGAFAASGQGRLS